MAERSPDGYGRVEQELAILPAVPTPTVAPTG